MEDTAITLEERQEQCKPLVLVVDDHAGHLKLLRLLAERLGVTVHTVSTAAQAIEALQLFSFDIILMDYRMPDVDGLMCTRLIRRMKENTSTIPIIAVTASVLPEDRAACLESGMDDFLPKPFTFEQLHEKLCYWLRRKSEETASA